VPIAIRGLRKKVHEEFQQYLDLVDWSGIGVEDRTRECRAAGEWFVTEEGRMPEALVQWLEKRETQEARSRAVDRATNIAEVVEQLNRLERNEEQALSRIDAGQQPTLATRGLLEWMTSERLKETAGLGHPAEALIRERRKEAAGLDHPAEALIRERQKEAAGLGHPAEACKTKWEIWKELEKEMHPEWRSVNVRCIRLMEAGRMNNTGLDFNDFWLCLLALV
jgi:hypothetical protein